MRRETIRMVVFSTTSLETVGVNRLLFYEKMMPDRVRDNYCSLVGLWIQLMHKCILMARAVTN